MKKILSTLIVTACFLVLAPQAKAAMVANGGDLSNWDGQTSIPAALYELTGSKLTDLATSIAQMNSTVIRSGKSVIYASTKGLMKLTLGQVESKAKTLYKGDDLEGLAVSGQVWVVADQTAKAKQAAFVYDIKSGKVKTFNTKVAGVTYASLAKGGTMVAILAKDAKAKNKVFISNGGLTTIVASDLPNKYSSCDKVVLSPAGTYAAFICKVSTTASGVVVAPVKDGKLGKVITVKYGDLVPGPLAWLNETSLIGLATAFSIDDAMKVTYDPQVLTVKIKNGKAAVAAPVSLGASAIVPAGDIIIAPLQIQVLSATKALFVYEYLGTDSNSQPVFSSVIGTYKTDTKKSSLLVNQATAFHYLAEAGF